MGSQEETNKKLAEAEKGLRDAIEALHTQIRIDMDKLKHMESNESEFRPELITNLKHRVDGDMKALSGAYDLINTMMEKDLMKMEEDLMTPQVTQDTTGLTPPVPPKKPGFFGRIFGKKSEGGKSRKYAKRRKYTKRRRYTKNRRR